MLFQDLVLYIVSSVVFDPIMNSMIPIFLIYFDSLPSPFYCPFSLVVAYPHRKLPAQRLTGRGFTYCREIDTLYLSVLMYRQ